MSNKSPDAYRTISEAGEETGLPTHVLRFWEGKFLQLKPMKRAGGRRFYRPQDILLLKGLKRLLYEEGYTIKGAQKYLREHGVAHVAGLAQSEDLSPLTSESQAEIAPSVGAAPELEDFGSSKPQDARDLFGNVVEQQPAALSRKDKSRVKKAYDKLAKARARLNAVLRA